MSSSVTQKKFEKKPGDFLVLVTGASRSGKSTYADNVVKWEPTFEVLHQDECYRDTKHMPKVKFAGSPLNITNWDSELSVDWSKLHQKVSTAFATSTRVLVEGTELLADVDLREAADMIVLLGVAKWTCFERRVDGGKRQHYLPYLEVMWAHYRELLDKYLPLCQSKVYFLDETDSHLKQSLSALRARAPLPDVRGCVEFFGKLTASSAERYKFRPIDEVALFRSEGLVSSVPAEMRKIAAMLLCHAFGDACGAPYEFPRNRKANLTRFEFLNTVQSGRAGVRGAAPGAVTDDHMMLLQLARTIIANNNHYDPVHATLAYIDWAQHSPAGMGYNTKALFQCTSAKGDAARLAAYNKAFAEKHSDANTRVLSNGSLMRAAALVFHRGTREEVVRAAYVDAALSNPYPENRGANMLYVAVLWDLIYGGRAIANICEWATPEYIRQHSDNCDAVVQAAMSALHGAEVKETLEGNDRGCVLTALWAALHFARMFRGDVGETLRTIVNLGGDCDTNAAIAGALIGAGVGWEALVAQQRANVELILNVPYEFCTLRNVLGLRPSLIYALLPRWKRQKDNIARPLESHNNEQEEVENSSTTTKKKRADRM